MVEASRDEAALAVRLYNDPAEVRSFEGLVVHMHLAWLYLLHAQLTRDEVDFRYWRKDKAHLLEKVDGEPRRWELARCVKERWPEEKDPVRANLEFFIGIRNRVEHRYARQQQALAAVVGGQAQALLLNYEEELVAQFGPAASLATRLRFPIFVGSFTDEGERTLRRLRGSLPASLRKFISEYHANLDPSTSGDPRFELRLRVLQELAPKDPDALAVQYTRYDDMTPEQRDAVEALGKKGVVVIRERQRGVVGHGLLKPTQAARKVEEQIPFKFGMGLFIKAWRKLQVRPEGGAVNPALTDERYCTYDARHNDYGYTEAYVKKLVREASTEANFRAFLGTAPKDKITGEWVGEPPVTAWPPQRLAPDNAEEASA